MHRHSINTHDRTRRRQQWPSLHSTRVIHVTLVSLLLLLSLLSPSLLTPIHAQDGSSTADFSTHDVFSTVDSTGAALSSTAIDASSGSLASSTADRSTADASTSSASTAGESSTAANPTAESSSAEQVSSTAPVDSSSAGDQSSSAGDVSTGDSSTGAMSTGDSSSVDASTGPASSTSDTSSGLDSSSTGVVDSSSSTGDISSSSGESANPSSSTSDYSSSSTADTSSSSAASSSSAEPQSSSSGDHSSSSSGAGGSSSSSSGDSSSSGSGGSSSSGSSSTVDSSSTGDSSSSSGVSSSSGDSSSSGVSSSSVDWSSSSSGDFSSSSSGIDSSSSADPFGNFSSSTGDFANSSSSSTGVFDSSTGSANATAAVFQAKNNAETFLITGGCVAGGVSIIVGIIACLCQRRSRQKEEARRKLGDIHKLESEKVKAKKSKVKLAKGKLLPPLVGGASVASGLGGGDDDQPSGPVPFPLERADFDGLDEEASPMLSSGDGGDVVDENGSFGITITGVDDHTESSDPKTSFANANTTKKASDLSLATEAADKALKRQERVARKEANAKKAAARQRGQTVSDDESPIADSDFESEEEDMKYNRHDHITIEMTRMATPILAGETSLALNSDYSNLIYDPKETAAAAAELAALTGQTVAEVQAMLSQQQQEELGNGGASIAAAGLGSAYAAGRTTPSVAYANASYEFDDVPPVLHEATRIYDDVVLGWHGPLEHDPYLLAIYSPSHAASPSHVPPTAPLHPRRMPYRVVDTHYSRPLPPAAWRTIHGHSPWGQTISLPVTRMPRWWQYHKGLDVTESPDQLKRVRKGARAVAQKKRSRHIRNPSRNMPLMTRPNSAARGLPRQTTPTYAYNQTANRPHTTPHASVHAAAGINNNNNNNSNGVGRSTQLRPSRLAGNHNNHNNNNNTTTNPYSHPPSTSGYSNPSHPYSTTSHPPRRDLNDLVRDHPISPVDVSRSGSTQSPNDYPLATPSGSYAHSNPYGHPPESSPSPSTYGGITERRHRGDDEERRGGYGGNSQRSTGVSSYHYNTNDDDDISLMGGGGDGATTYRGYSSFMPMGDETTQQWRLDD